MPAATFFFVFVFKAHGLRCRNEPREPGELTACQCRQTGYQITECIPPRGALRACQWQFDATSSA